MPLSGTGNPDIILILLGLDQSTREIVFHASYNSVMKTIVFSSLIDCQYNTYYNKCFITKVKMFQVYSMGLWA